MIGAHDPMPLVDQDLATIDAQRFSTAESSDAADPYNNQGFKDGLCFAFSDNSSFGTFL